MRSDVNLALLIPAVLIGAAIVVLMLVLWAAVDPARRRAVKTLGSSAAPRRASPLLVRAAPAVSVGRLERRLLEVVTGRVSASSMDSIQTKLDRAGVAAPWTAARVVLVRSLAVVGVVPLGLIVAVMFGPLQGLGLIGIGAASSMIAPGFVLDRVSAVRRREIGIALADMIDLMTILVEAGIAFESAMIQTASSSSGPLSDEFQRAIREIQIGVPRSQALRGIADRCEVADLSTVVSAIIQAERFGVPIARVMRVQSSELRDKRRQRAEEMAMKIPAKIVLPLGLCILPAMMIVVVGPAVLSLARSFAQF